MRSKRGRRDQKSKWSIGRWLKRYWAKKTCRRSDDAALTLDELAQSQNVQPVADVRALFGTWPGEDDDGFEALNDATRKPQKGIEQWT